MEKYTKSSENQDLNDFLLETLASPEIINSQKPRIVSFSKNMLFSREFLYIDKLFTAGFFLNSQKKFGGLEKGWSWNGRSLIAL